MKTHLENLLLTTHFSTWKVKQVIALDWYDGPLQGLCELREPACCFRFDIFAYSEWGDETGDHLFRISELPIQSVQFVIELLSKHLEPKSPIWVPIWTFADEQIRESIRVKIRDVYSKSKQTRIIIRTSNMREFLGCWVAYEGSTGF